MKVEAHIYGHGIQKAVIASDSFKGSLTSAEVASAISAGIKEVFPECRVLAIEAADGGEGTMTALMKVLGGKTVEAEVHDPLMRPVKAVYGISDDGTTAIMEMSAASGLCLLGTDERNPMKTTTFGTGEMIADASRRGCRRFLVGIGGSATNDAGTGMLAALGARFLSADGRILPGTGEALPHIAGIDLSGIPEAVSRSEFTVACDVDSPFCGPDGAAYTFAPQKGADARTAEALDLGMEAFSRTVTRMCGYDMRHVKGAGAAGGLGGAFAAFLNARLVSGSELVLETAGFDALARDADIVFTGEGRIDSQTSKGKLPYCVLKHASRLGIPVIAVAGSVSPGTDPGFTAVFPVLCSPCSAAEAMDPETASRNIRRTVKQIMKVISSSFHIRSSL